MNEESGCSVFLFHLYGEKGYEQWLYLGTQYSQGENLSQPWARGHKNRHFNLNFPSRPIQHPLAVPPSDILIQSRGRHPATGA